MKMMTLVMTTTYFSEKKATKQTEKQTKQERNEGSRIWVVGKK